MSKIAVIGMVGNSAFLSVPQFHRGGETVTAENVHFEPGGKGFNQAVAAARFGAEVSFLGAVGEQGGAEIAAFAAAEGIDASFPAKAGQTAYAAILTDRTGANHVTVYQGAPLTVEDVDTFADRIAAADILLLNNEVPEAVNVRAVEIAKEYGVRVILNPAPARATCAYLLETVDLFTPNEFERIALGNQTNMIVTLGEKGSLLVAENVIVPARSLGPTVDTTGAGDTFSGVLAAKWAEGVALQQAAECAALAAGISVTRPYAATSIPTRNEMDQY
ncbi:MAG: ribokinase [Clostridia bacterium]|nr:ribokinase [Clostridia bacterium]